MANGRIWTDGPSLFQTIIKKCLDVLRQRYPGEFTHHLVVESRRLGITKFQLEIISDTVLRDHEAFQNDVMQTIHLLLKRKGHISVGFTDAKKGQGSVVVINRAEYSMYWDRETRLPKKGYYNKYIFKGVIRKVDE